MHGQQNIKIHTNKVHDVHITVIFRLTSPIPWVPTKMNCYPSHNHKQHSPTSNSSGSNIINHIVLLPENLLLKFYNFEHRTKMKFEAPQKQINQKR